MRGTVFLNRTAAGVVGQQRIASGTFDNRLAGELGECLARRTFARQIEDRSLILTDKVKQWSPAQYEDRYAQQPVKTAA